MALPDASGTADGVAFFLKIFRLFGEGGGGGADDADGDCQPNEAKKEAGDGRPKARRRPRAWRIDRNRGRAAKPRPQVRPLRPAEVAVRSRILVRPERSFAPRSSAVLPRVRPLLAFAFPSRQCRLGSPRRLFDARQSLDPSRRGRTMSVPAYVYRCEMLGDRSK